MEYQSNIEKLEKKLKLYEEEKSNINDTNSKEIQKYIEEINEQKNQNENLKNNITQNEQLIKKYVSNRRIKF